MDPFRLGDIREQPAGSLLLVSERYREIGVRMAVGASRADVLGFVLGYAARRSLVGIGIGIAASISLCQAMRPFLIDISPIDPGSQAGVALAILVAALAASALPAYHASRVDPIEALRHQ